MDKNKCPKVDLETIPEKIFGLVSKDINWFELVKLYNLQNSNTNYLITNPIMEKICKDEKCKKNKKMNNLGNINLHHLLQFLGAFRKIIIDSIASQTIKTINKEKYRETLNLGNIPLGNVIISSALGSDNITSDYDIIFSGPGAYKIVSCIGKKFNDYVKNNIYNGKKKNTMAAVFDSNFYLTPYLVVNKKVLDRLKKVGVTEYFDMEHVFPDAVSSLSLKKIIPIPTYEIIDLELNALKNKIMDFDLEPYETDKIEKKYNDLISKGEELDAFLYRSNKYISKKWKIVKSSKDFFKKLMDIKKSELEAYYCFSTILIVVIGMQDNKFKTSNLYNKLDAGNFLVGVVENIVDLVKHQNHNIDAIPKKGAKEKKRIINNKNVAVKFSKYFKRIFTCLDYYFKKHNKKNPFSKDLKLINKVVENRKLNFFQ